MSFLIWNRELRLLIQRFLWGNICNGFIRLYRFFLLLWVTESTVMDIAMETGYCNGDYLSAQFKKKTGMTPSEYRKQHVQFREQFIAGGCGVLQHGAYSQA